MEIILLEKIERLGSLGDVVRVRPGYARNYLIPMGKAKYATEANREEVQAHRTELERKAVEALSAAEQRKAKLDGFKVTVMVETNQEGKLFGSVGAGEISRSITEAGPELERHEVRLPDGPLRSLGEHSVDIHIHTGIEATVSVTIESSGVIEIPVELQEEADAAPDTENADATPDAEDAETPSEETPAEQESTG